MENSLFIYCPFPVSNRLQYILEWIFNERLKRSFQLSSNKEVFQSFSGPKLNYSLESFPMEVLTIKPHPILFETDIREQQLSIQRWKKTTVLFYNQPGSKIPFDLFSAIFYLISRYEEYLPHQKDKHGRYDVKQSAAYQFGFLREPLIDKWLYHFEISLQISFGFALSKRRFQFLPSFDIDMAWKFLHKPKGMNVGGWIKNIFKGQISEIKERFFVTIKGRLDPFYSFDQLNTLHSNYSLHPLLFILLGKRSRYDRNTEPTHPAMLQLMKELRQSYECGIHPSYQSHQNKEIVQNEMNILQAAIQKPVIKSRQHFIKFNLPSTYQILIELGIQEDYSMGYAALNGFRASTSHSFLWYDLSKEQKTGLRIFPFAFMDATSKFYLHQNQEQAFQEWLHFYREIKLVEGQFISIWHNYILSNPSDKKSWLPFYERTLNHAFAGSYSQE